MNFFLKFGDNREIIEIYKKNQWHYGNIENIKDIMAEWCLFIFLLNPNETEKYHEYW